MQNPTFGIGLAFLVLGLCSGLEGQARDRLTVSDLFGEATPPLVQNRYFLPLGEHEGAGRLSETLYF